MASPRRVASTAGAVADRWLVTPPAGEDGRRRRIQLFASSPADPRARRPVDWLRAVLYLVALVLVAVLAVFSPYVTLPFRTFGRVLIAAEVIGTLFLGATLGLDAVASVTIGLLAGAVVHLVRGSPGGLPTVGRVRAALPVRPSPSALRSHQLGRLALRRAPPRPRRHRRHRGRPLTRPHSSRRSLRDRVRHRALLPLHHLLPAADLGLRQLPLADLATFHLNRADRFSRPTGCCAGPTTIRGFSREQ